MAVGPLRIWKQGAHPPSPGLTMSRSFGDGLAKTCGVISLPEIKKDKIDGSLRFIVLASDGIWEVFSSNEVATIIERLFVQKNPTEAVKLLADEANKKWLEVRLSEMSELHR